MTKSSTLINRRNILVASAAGAVALAAGRAIGQTSEQAPASPKAGFSFAAYGDSRPMMYLPSKEGNPDLTKLFVEMFGLVMPDKVAEEVVKRDVKLTFDPATKELIQVVMPFMSKTEVMTLTVDKGWVTEASVEDVKLLPGVHRTMFRLAGRRMGGARDRAATSIPGAPNLWSTAATSSGGEIRDIRSVTALTGSA